MSVSGAWRRLRILPAASPPDFSRSLALRLRRGLLAALLCLPLLAGAATQAHAQALPCFPFSLIACPNDRGPDRGPDGQALPVVSFPKIFQTVSEGVGTHNVKLMLNPAPTSDITVPYIVVTHRATWGSDFTIANGGTVSVRAGATTATIPVTIFDDTEAEPNEHFEVRLRKGTDYRLGPAALYMLVIARSDPTVVSLAPHRPRRRA